MLDDLLPSLRGPPGVRGPPGKFEFRYIEMSVIKRIFFDST